MKSARLISQIAFFFALSLGALAQTPADPHKPVLDRLASLVTLPLPEWRYAGDMPHPEDATLDDSQWQAMHLHDKWQPGRRVFRKVIVVPETINGYAVRGARLRLDLYFTSPGKVLLSEFSNGALVFHGDDDQQQVIALTESAQPGERFVVAVRADATEKEAELNRSQLLIEPPASRPDPGFFRTEVLSVKPVIAAYAEGRETREQQLDAAVQAVDFSTLDRGDQAGFDASLRAAQGKLQLLNPYMKQFTIHAVGNSHIDMAWLWPWTETVEVTRNTFRSALDLMNEYPDFKFTMSSARTYEWMEEKYPDLFAEIRQRVKEGRWEVIGGMWVEPDLNLPAGESLVRQILVGKRYFQSRFGVDVKIGWNPDSFGYNWQLPQIYKKSGMDYFVTQKLLWAQDYTKFPYRLFWWEAPDGSRLLTYFPHDYAGGIEPERMATDVAFYAPNMYGPKLGDSAEMMHLYGVGDHGGGPTRAMLDMGEKLRAPDAVYPKFEYGTAQGFFDDMEKRLPQMNVPVWRDELYFEYHRGVQTTQAQTKARIRRGEELLLTAEKFSSVASLFGKAYPTDDMQLAWKGLLFDHFHDIMPGSGIAVNYLEAKRNLEDVSRMGRQALDGALDEIAARVDTQGTGVPVVVFNPLGWSRTDVVEVEAQLPEPATQVEVFDAAGKAAPSQLLSMEAATHRVHLLLMATVPSLGYRTYYVRPASSAPKVSTPLTATATTLENAFLHVVIDAKTGCMTSLIDKRTSTEVLAPAETDTGGPKDRICGNLLQAFHDLPKQWDAWNVDADFEDQHWDLMKADEVKLVESGPLRAVIRIRQHFQNSTFVQDVTMYAGVARVDVKTQVEWHEKHILLKVAFPLSAHNDNATFEIPYGSIERPTTRRTPAEQGKFEVPAIHWADISDAKHGFSLINDSKYGYDAKGNVLRLSLLRSPEWPDPHADEGHQEFTYTLYPHNLGWQQAWTVRRGYEVNEKLVARQVAHHTGALPEESAFVEVLPENALLTAVKQAEDGDALIVRFYEWAGKAGNVRIRLPQGAQSAEETNLMEKGIGPLELKGNVVTVPTKPYEIKTIKVRFDSAPR